MLEFIIIQGKLYRKKPLRLKVGNCKEFGLFVGLLVRALRLHTLRGGLFYVMNLMID